MKERLRSTSKIRRHRYTYADYEAAKQDWSYRHPQATPSEYQQAMRKISERMGL